MPRKIRQLRADLAHHGFVKERGRGKGSHTYWTHPRSCPTRSSSQDTTETTPITIRSALTVTPCVTWKQPRRASSHE